MSLLSSTEVLASKDLQTVKDEYTKLAAATYSFKAVAIVAGAAALLGFILAKVL